jgi:hypothetical protein
MADANRPDVVQLLLCESAAYDETQNSWVLVRPTAHLHVRGYREDPFPHVIPRLAAYFQLIDAFGTVSLQLQVAAPSLGSGMAQVLMRSDEYLVTFPPNRTVLDGVIRLEAVPILEAAEYEVRLLAAGQRLGERSVAYLRVTGETMS